MDGGRRNLQAVDEELEEEQEELLPTTERRSLTECVNDLEPVENLQLKPLQAKWYPQSEILIFEEKTGVNAHSKSKDDIYCPELDIRLKRKSSSLAKDRSGKMVRNDAMYATMSFQQ